MRPALLCLCALAALGMPNLAGAAGSRTGGHTIYQSAALWSTVDICNTPAHPRTVGIRGSMPGSGIAAERMFMRFQVQYRSSGGVWTFIGSQADSGFVSVGSASFKARETGRSFQIAARSGSSFVLRGVVTFQWRRGKHLVRRAQKATTAGHRTGAGADPKGYSAASCTLS